jgi:hypothetical protein
MCKYVTRGENTELSATSWNDFRLGKFNFINIEKGARIVAKVSQRVNVNARRGGGGAAVPRIGQFTIWTDGRSEADAKHYKRER